jgi:hypothetical protein
MARIAGIDLQKTKEERSALLISSELEEAQLKIF